MELTSIAVRPETNTRTGVANGTIRCPIKTTGLGPGKDDDNEDKTLLPNTLFVRTIDTELRSQIVENMMKDNLIKDAITALKTKGPPPIKSQLLDWKMESGLLFFKEKCVVPLNEELQRNLG